MVPKPTTPPRTQRIFIGIPVDRHSQQHTNELVKPIRRSRQDIRWEPERNRHLTLAFLGNIQIQEVQNLLQMFDEPYRQEKRFQYKLNTLTRFPDSTGRVIALVDDPTAPLEHLFQITLKLLQENNLKPDRKEFRPHITLGRIKRVKHVKANFSQRANIKLVVDRITLFQSTLSESGSIYSPLKETKLS
jgi:2'-5' RNA ligase